jgi:hypothetical protein
MLNNFLTVHARQKHPQTIYRKSMPRNRMLISEFVGGTTWRTKLLPVSFCNGKIAKNT